MAPNLAPTAGEKPDACAVAQSEPEPSGETLAWAEIFGDAVAVKALVDRLVRHSHIITLKGDSYRLKDKHDEMATANETH